MRKQLHLATGAQKQQLAQELGLGGGGGRQNPWDRELVKHDLMAPGHEHWRMHSEAQERRLGVTLLLMENPHDVLCPHQPAHVVRDMYLELLPSKGDREAVVRGQAAMHCPSCGQLIYWPKTCLHDPAPAVAPMPVVYWSQAAWDKWTPEMQQLALGRVPTLLGYLR